MRLGYTDVFQCVSKSVISEGKYLFKCTYWNDVFCAITLCTNPSSPGCVFSLHSIKLYHVFVLRYKNHCRNETKVSTYSPFFLYQTEKTWLGVNEGRHIQFSLYFYITRWDKIYHSNTYI